MINYIKSKPWLYRGLRTFLQSFLSTLAAQFVLITESELNEKFIMSIVVSSMAAGLSAVMNLKEGEENVG